MPHQSWCIFLQVSVMNEICTFSFCVCASGSVSDVYPCVDVSSPSLSHDLVPHLLLWSERSGGVLNDGRTNCLHPWINNFQQGGKKKEKDIVYV